MLRSAITFIFRTVCNEKEKRMNRIIIAALWLAIGLAPAAQADDPFYFLDRNEWGIWTATDQQVSMTVTYSEVSQAPDTIPGNYYGSFSLQPASGNFGNITVPLVTNAGWVAGNTYAINFDIKIVDNGGYRLCSQLYTRPGHGMDGYINIPELDMTTLGDGKWHHVEIVFETPKGYEWTGGSVTGYADATTPGMHDFDTFGNIVFTLFRNAGPHNYDHSLSWLVDNISIMDVTLGVEYAMNGDFSDFDETTGLPVGYNASGGFVNPVLVGTDIPEPATMTLLALGGLALLRRRR
jgi:hypothetical protein